MEKTIYLKKDTAKIASKLVSFDFLMEEYTKTNPFGLRLQDSYIMFEGEKFELGQYRYKKGLYQEGYVSVKSGKLIQNVLKKNGYSTKDKVLKYFYKKEIKLSPLNVKQLKKILEKLDDSIEICINDCEWGISSIDLIELDEENNRLAISI